MCVYIENIMFNDIFNVLCHHNSFSPSRHIFISRIPVQLEDKDKIGSRFNIGFSTIAMLFQSYFYQVMLSAAYM